MRQKPCRVYPTPPKRYFSKMSMEGKLNESEFEENKTNGKMSPLFSAENTASTDGQHKEGDSGETRGDGNMGRLVCIDDKFWILRNSVPCFQAFQDSFERREEDLWLATGAKTGTTWTKAILHCILSLTPNSADDHNLNEIENVALLDRLNPHSIVPCAEIIGERADVEVTYPGGGRLLHTHLPFHGLPPALQNSSSKIVYVMRNPRDTFVSLWQFHNRIHESEAYKSLTKDAAGRTPSKEEVFEDFCRGRFHGGPFAEHVLSYWNEHKKNPERVLWLSYEDLKADGVNCVLKMGRFIGLPCDLIEKRAASIVDKCSFEKLSNVEVNKTGTRKTAAPILFNNSIYFRAGVAGGWREYFTPEMEKRMHDEIERKLEEAGVPIHY